VHLTKSRRAAAALQQGKLKVGRSFAGGADTSKLPSEGVTRVSSPMGGTQFPLFGGTLGTIGPLG